MNKLIVQLPVDGGTDFDFLIHVEESLSRAFEIDRLAIVAGHDIGQGRFNIFIHLAGPWEPVIERAVGILQRLKVSGIAVVAKTAEGVDAYAVVHPDPHPGEFAL